MGRVCVGMILSPLITSARVAAAAVEVEQQKERAIIPIGGFLLMGCEHRELNGRCFHDRIKLL